MKRMKFRPQILLLIMVLGAIALYGASQGNNDVSLPAVVALAATASGLVKDD